MIELKSVLLALLATAVMFALTFVSVWGIRYYTEVVLVVLYLSTSYFAYRTIRNQYENNS